MCMFVYMKKGIRKLCPKFTEEQLGVNTFASSDNLMILVNIGYNDENEREYEKEDYSKMFSSPQKRLKVSKLSAQAKELLMWIVYELRPAKDYFWFNRDRFMVECGIKSPTSVSLAVKELKNEFIIASKVREIYFINPNFFFSGSRLNKYPESIINGLKSKGK